MTALAPATAARSAVAAASTARLTTYPCAPQGRWTTTAPVRDAGAGAVQLALDAGSVAVRHVRRRRVVTLDLAPRGFAPVRLHGRVDLRRDGEEASVVVVPLAVRLGGRPGVGVPVDSYTGAQVDPVAVQAPSVLDHLDRRHAGELAACLRAHGVPVAWARAHALDAAGLTLLGVTPDGVTTLRLAFPAPVRRLADLGPGLAATLRCRCDG